MSTTKNKFTRWMFLKVMHRLRFHLFFLFFGGGLLMSLHWHSCPSVMIICSHPHSHFKNITKVAFFHLRNIARIRPFLSRPDAERLIHAFITSRLDYCNSLFGGLPANSVKRLQYIQNSAARVLTHTSARHHITPVLQQLHWLPVQSRIEFKTLILTYKAVHRQAPDYICNLVTLSTPSRSLRSAGCLSLYQPHCKLKTMGGRAFSYNGPKLWNALPAFIRNAVSLDCFKKLLKTHLFSKAFNVWLFTVILFWYYVVLVDLLFCCIYCSALSLRKAHYK